MHLVSNSGTNQNNHGTAITTIFTAAELFPDGSAIDLMRRSQLIWWNGTTEEITPMIEFGGTTYRPTPLHTSVEEALRLPSGGAPYGTIEALIKALAKAAHDHIGLEAPASLLIAAFVAATWVPECLPGRGLVLNVWSPTATEPATLDFIEAVVRRPLRLLEFVDSGTLETPSWAAADLDC